LPDRVIINVSVTEESTGSISVGGGYSTSDGFVAEIALTEKNFLGRGQNLRVAYGMGEETNNFNISFTDPYFLGYRMSAGFDAYSKSSDSSDNKPYNSEAYGGGVRLGLPITEDLTFTVNYKASTETISSVNAGGAGDNATPYYQNGDTITSSLGYGLVYSTIDNTMDPRDGIHFKVNQDFAGVGGDVAYMKTVADARYYHEIMYDSDIVGMVRLQGGNIVGLGQNVRIADNFFKGGETIRGFAPYGIGARDVVGDSLGDDGIPLGGQNYVAATAEVQFPFPFMPPDFGLRGAVFADAGTLFGIDKPAGVNVNDDASIRSSVGASLLWASPFGLLRADFAYALTKESYDETQVFRFSAGTNF
jgi:outer membrane protein insertion porin family